MWFVFIINAYLNKSEWIAGLPFFKCRITFDDWNIVFASKISTDFGTPIIGPYA